MKKNKANLELMLKKIRKANPPGLDIFIENIVPEYYKRLSDISMKHFADRILSDYVKISDADLDWYCKCCTCWTKMQRNDKMMQNGHYRSRGYMKYRYDTCNCHPQCYTCNVIHSWAYRNYHKFMVETYGEKLEEKIWNDQEIVKIHDYDLVMLCVDRYSKILSCKEVIYGKQRDS